MLNTAWYACTVTLMMATFAAGPHEALAARMPGTRVFIAE